MSILQGLLGSIGGTLPPNYYLSLGGIYGEGNTTSLTMYYEHADGQTLYWSIENDSAAAGVDFTSDSGYSGSLSPTGSGYQVLANITAINDNTTEGTEYYRIKLASFSGGADIDQLYININDTSVDATADFTIEWWSKMDNYGSGNYARLFNVGSYSDETPGISFEGSSTIYLWEGAGALRDSVYSADFSKGQWVHWAIARHNNTIALYKNGANLLTSNNGGPAPLNDVTHPLTIGWGSSQYWNGKITGFNWVKGIARYTANFFPVRQQPAITAGYTKLMLNVPSESNMLVDAATAKTVTANGTVSFSTDTPWTEPSPVTSTLFGAGDTLGVFTVHPDGWSNLKPGWTISRVGGGWSSTVVYWNGGNEITAADNWLNDGADYTFTPPTSVVRTSIGTAHGAYYSVLYYDQSYTNLTNVKAGWTAIGPGGSYSDVVAEDVVWNGSDYKVKLIYATEAPPVGEWTFTPPQQTGSLVFNNSYLSYAASDDWGIDVPGRSLSFNGSQGRYVIVSDTTSDWALGDTYTIEWWEKIPDSAGFYPVLCQAAAYSSIDIYHNAGSIGMCNGQFNFPEPTTGQWNHIVIQKDGTTATAYVNGVSQTLTINNQSTLSDSTLNLVVGNRTSDGGSNFYPNQKFKGYLTNIRISDVARYSGTFTPPLTLTVDANTKLALSGALGSAGPLDDVSSGNHTITNNLTEVAFKFPSLP